MEEKGPKSTLQGSLVLEQASSENTATWGMGAVPGIAVSSSWFRRQ